MTQQATQGMGSHVRKTIRTYKRVCSFSVREDVISTSPRREKTPLSTHPNSLPVPSEIECTHNLAVAGGDQEPRVMAGGVFAGASASVVEGHTHGSGYSIVNQVVGLCAL